MSEHAEDLYAEEDEPEIVHWMEPRPLTLGPGAVSAAAAGAFVAGVVVTLGTLALMHWLGPERELSPPR